jgi:hypothetical protein
MSLPVRGFAVAIPKPVAKVECPTGSFDHEFVIEAS